MSSRARLLVSAVGSMAMLVAGLFVTGVHLPQQRETTAALVLRYEVAGWSDVEAVVVPQTCAEGRVTVRWTSGERVITRAIALTEADRAAKLCGSPGATLRIRYPPDAPHLAIPDGGGVPELERTLVQRTIRLFEGLLLLLAGLGLLLRDAPVLLRALVHGKRPWRASHLLSGFKTMAVPAANPEGLLSLLFLRALPLALLPIVVMLAWDFRDRDLIMPAGLALAAGLVRLSYGVFRRRFDERRAAAVLEFGRLPYRPGERFDAIMRLPATVPGTAEVDARITVTGADGKTLAESPFTLPRDFVQQTGEQSTLIIKTSLPAAPPESDDAVWQLHLSAASRDRTFSAAFVLPVHNVGPRLIERNEGLSL